MPFSRAKKRIRGESNKIRLDNLGSWKLKSRNIMFLRSISLADLLQSWYSGCTHFICSVSHYTVIVYIRPISWASSLNLAIDYVHVSCCRPYLSRYTALQQEAILSQRQRRGFKYHGCIYYSCCKCRYLVVVLFCRYIFLYYISHLRLCFLYHDICFSVESCLLD